ncbi:CoA transferase [Mesorhizobium sp. M5C.F.Cr.IN.023.01.1.1]|uniref:CaiB/BaiF CoA transferase family protein n=1 Tax=Mesorhizobium sp. M5C.F.Cr.IN.023.01.1.1 TaxID=2496768 RepID=UPI000FCACC86|nr:CaiB/BaiF CoA-transferase family protein [Mesorhizobium sp. M5C.F.Cr.IN.023.01.1.1]RUV77473.1 CoA transferase [Mesorhizobium sp. M5C.F.Cr.IN.023.01.1.1]
MIGSPLEGVRILSLAEQYPGPYATLLLADLGAEVTLIERPDGGDPARKYKSLFSSLSRNKRSVVLDLKSAAGRESLSELSKTADVLIEGYRPDVMKKLGLSYVEVSSLNRRLIYLSLTGFGQNGPYRRRPVHDLSCQGLAGVLFQHRRTGTLQVPFHLPVADLASGTLAALGVVSALLARERTGHGCYIDLAMTDSLVSWMTAYLYASLNGRPMAEVYEEEPGYGTFTCADKKVITLSIAHEDHYWQALCRSTGLEHLASATHEDRVQHASDYRAQLAAAIAKEPLDAWANIFNTIEIPWGDVLELNEVARDPQLRTRDLFVRLSANDDGEWHVNQPLQFDCYKTGIRLPPPKLGEHTQEILSRCESSPTALSGER